MKTGAIAAITVLVLVNSAPAFASSKPAAKVTAAKAPFRLTLRVAKTRVKMDRSLWYKIELKNISRKKAIADDWIFKDPWGMQNNCNAHYGVYLEIIAPDGKPMRARAGGERVQHDWEPKNGGPIQHTAEEQQELSVLRADWQKRGLTTQQQHLAFSRWESKIVQKRNIDESRDPAKQLWLAPGASTATFAWMDRGPGDYPGRAEDDETLSNGYTQLWSYDFLDPGKYRVRAVYNYSQSESVRELFRKNGDAPDPGWIEFKTPFIEFEVLP